MRKQREYEKPEFGTLAVKDVSFSYNKEKVVLKNINITFQKGSKVALVGRNGSGMSTLINLLTRMNESSEGEILLSGQDISSFPIQAYRNMVSIVYQQIYLFNDTIRNNICLYKEVNDSIIMELINDSGLADFVSEVSLNYIVGENGSMLVVAYGTYQELFKSSEEFSDMLSVKTLDEIN